MQNFFNPWDKITSHLYDQFLKFLFNKLLVLLNKITSYIIV